MFVYMNTNVRTCTDAWSVHTLIHMSIHSYTIQFGVYTYATRTHTARRDKQWLTSRVSVDGGAGATCRWAVTLQRVTARDEAL